MTRQLEDITLVGPQNLIPFKEKQFQVWKQNPTKNIGKSLGWKRITKGERQDDGDDDQTKDDDCDDNDSGDDADDWRNLCGGEEEVLWGEGEGLGASLAGTCPKPWALKMIIKVQFWFDLVCFGQVWDVRFGRFGLVSLDWGKKIKTVRN